MTERYVLNLLEAINDWHSPLPDKIQMNQKYFDAFSKEAPKFYDGLFSYDWSKGKKGMIKGFCRVPIEITPDAFLGYWFVHEPEENKND